VKTGSFTPVDRATVFLHTRLWRGSIFPVVAVCHAVSGLLLMRLYPHHMTTDTPSYISIARHYAEGRFHDAVNWFWSPLISWLLAPFLRIGMDPISSLHLLGLTTGLAGLIGCRGIFRELGLPERAQNILLLALIPVLHAFSLVNPNPDLLVAVLLLFYVRLVIARDYAENPWIAAFCGLLGALAYFAKAYAFPFFAAHFLLVNVCRHIGERDFLRRRNVRRSCLLGLAAFLLLSSAWIGVLYAKYGRLTISTIGEYNFRLVNDVSGVSYLSDGFAEPPVPTALSAWEDPTQLAEARLKPIDASRVIEDTVSRIGRNILNTIDAYQAGSVFAMASLALTAIGLIGLSPRAMLGNARFLVLLTVLLLPAGYLPLLMNRRYLYIGLLLIYALGGSLLLGVTTWSSRRRTAALFILCFSFMLLPLRDLRANVHFNREIYELATFFAAQGVQGRIASNGSYDRSLFLTHFLAGERKGAAFLGVSRSGASAGELEDALRRHAIDYYLCWAQHSCDLRPGFPAIVPGGHSVVRVYRVR